MDPQNLHTNTSVSTRIQHWYYSLYLCTRSVFTACIAIFVVQAVLGLELNQVCLLANSVIQRWQVWRIFSSIVFHGGIMHVAFNMMAFLPSAKQLESQLGTVKFFYLILQISAIEGIMYIMVMYMLDISKIWESAASTQCAVGFSGVIFGLIAVSTQESQINQYSVFGLFQVPAKYYPWVLLGVIQLLSPRVSLVGHVAGLMAGYMYAFGYLRAIQLSNSLTGRIENVWPICLINKLDSFIKAGSPLPVSQSPKSQNTQSSSQQNYQASLATMLRQMTEGKSSTEDGTKTSQAKDDKFQGQGRVLGSTNVTENQEVAEQSKPWAAAAEARAKKYGNN